jgi:hypothetical protein
MLVFFFIIFVLKTCLSWVFLYIDLDMYALQAFFLKKNLVYLQIQQEKHSVKIGKIHYFFLIKSITEKAKYYVTTI